MSDKDLQIGKIEFNNFNPSSYLNKILNVEESVKMQTHIDNKVFQLAEKIKQDMSDLIEDQKQGQHDIEYINACLCNSQVILENMESLWGINLKEYYVTTLLL